MVNDSLFIAKWIIKKLKRTKPTKVSNEFKSDEAARKQSGVKINEFSSRKSENVS